MHIYITQTQTRSEPQQTQIYTQFSQRIPKFPSKTRGQKKQTTLREEFTEICFGRVLGSDTGAVLGGLLLPLHLHLPVIGRSEAWEAAAHLPESGTGKAQTKWRVPKSDAETKKGTITGVQGGRIGRPWEVRRGSERPKVGAFSTLLEFGSSSSPPPSLLPFFTQQAKNLPIRRKIGGGL